MGLAGGANEGEAPSYCLGTLSFGTIEFVFTGREKIITASVMTLRRFLGSGSYHDSVFKKGDVVVGKFADYGLSYSGIGFLIVDGKVAVISVTKP